MQTQERTDSRHLTTSGDRASTVATRAREARRLLIEAWNASPPAGKLAAICVAITAVATSIVTGVHITATLTVAAAVPAAVVDVHVRRLPDPLVAVAALVGLVTFAIETIGGAALPIAGPVLGALVMGGPILLLHLVSPRSMGFGDVKLGAVLGAALGVVHWQLGLSGLALAAGLSAVVALSRRRDTIAFGPGLVVGALLALAGHAVLIPAGADPIESTPSSTATPTLVVDEERA